MPEEVLEFWFAETDPRQWGSASAAFDEQIRARFAATHHRATLGELSDWRQSAGGRLAEIILLDQFSRNLYRHSALAFAQDGMALVLAQEAIAAGAEQALTAIQRSFLYLPFMHSESPLIHTRAVELYRANGLPDNYAFELRHKEIIDRFGRYPHRNQLLGRISSAEESAFLALPGSHF